MSLALTDEVRAALARAGESAYPREGCALLLGRRRGSDRGPRLEISDVVVARNLASRPDRFRLHPVDQLAAEEEARALGLEVVAYWHSHPGAPARPSARDTAQAWPGQVQLISRVDGGPGASRPCHSRPCHSRPCHSRSGTSRLGTSQLSAWLRGPTGFARLPIECGPG